MSFLDFNNQLGVVFMTITPSQRAREAAAELYLKEKIISSGPRVGQHSEFDLARAQSMREGEYDHWDMVQAFDLLEAETEKRIVDWLQKRGDPASLYTARLIQSHEHRSE